MARKLETVRTDPTNINPKVNVVLVIVTAILLIITLLVSMACGDALKAFANGFAKTGVWGILAVITIALLVGLLAGRIWAIHDYNKAMFGPGEV